MRHRAKASPYAMEFLFTQLILALKSEGFETLSLGVAPLSGVRRQPLSSRWHWIGAQIWKHGDRFYNFQGLRTFKGKFNPVWEPRYLAASGTVGPSSPWPMRPRSLARGSLDRNRRRTMDSFRVSILALP